MALKDAVGKSLGLESSPPSLTWSERFLANGCMVASGPGMVWVGWGHVQEAESPREDRLSLFVPDFFLEDARPWRLYEFGEEMAVEELLSRLGGLRERAPNIEWYQPSHSEFSAVFGDIQNRIQAGELSKAVPVIFRSAETYFDLEVRVHLVRKALRASLETPLMPYGFWTVDDGIFGATPEILFEQVNSRELHTMALAGTRRTREEGVSLLADSKEVFEHRVVVDGISERLNALGAVSVGKTEEVRLPALIHLHTDISVRANQDLAFEEGVAALHPTPAIGAWPREPGSRWLRAQRNAGLRSRFGAPFGVIPPGRRLGHCLVAIRNVQWDSLRVWMMAGCGIVGASRLENEWTELNNKLDSIQEALDL